MSVWEVRSEKYVNEMCLEEGNDGKVEMEAYQAGFKKKKSTISRIFIIYTGIKTELDENKRQQLGVFLVDFEQFFDTIVTEILCLRMVASGYSRKLVRLTWNLAQCEGMSTVSGDSGQPKGRPAMVSIGIPCSVPILTEFCREPLHMH